MATLSEVLQPEPVPLYRQIHEMELLCPQFTSSWYCDEVVWTGFVRPHDAAQRYKIQVKYRIGEAPVVDVLEPTLKRRDPMRAIPHMYDGEHLCLYLPFGFEWDACKLVAKTIIPWTMLWLHHYEVWRVTGDWMGGGQHPRTRRRS